VLAPDDQRLLFQLARDALRARFEGAPPPPLPASEALAPERGVFVTLRRRGELRGCIGHSTPRAPLAAAVRELACAAAFDDRRFDPLEAHEQADLEIELSVLTPLEPLAAADLVVGRHGLVIRHRGRSGLLLPQVASERGWTPVEFLMATCRKAGLPPDAWRAADCQILGFGAEKYEEGRAGDGGGR
jgi:AmmeMemoRadiSam system protein A